MTDILIILALTVGACAAVGLIGAGLLRELRRSSIRYQLMIATLVPVVAVAAAVAVNVAFMFLSPHDSAVVVLALLVSVGLAGLLAYLVVRPLIVGTSQVSAAVRQLEADTAGRGDGTRPPLRSDAPALPQELAQVVTALDETRVAVADSRARERAAEQSRRELVSFMSHDLRTPLAGLRALAEALEDGVITDVPAALAHLRGTVNRMTALVDDLFALSRVQVPPPSKRETMVSLAELLQDVAAEALPSAAARSVRIDVNLPGDDRLAVLGVADDLTRAFANLVTNAVRHTDPGLSVRVMGRRAADGHVQIAVVDACGGIPADFLPRVFDTGWRGTPSRSGDADGAGLGLAIARGVVQSHAGRIAVGNVDGGCRFEVSLPPPPERAS